MNRNYVPSLGNGIYVVSIDNSVGVDNVKPYVSEHIGCTSLLLVKCVYNGKYTECICGGGREGYIVIENNISSNDIGAKIIDIDVFFTVFLK